MKTGRVKFLMISFAFGLVSGTVFLWLGLVHNAQSEFYLPSGGLDYSYCIKLFVSWFLIGSLMGAVAFVVYWLLMRLFSRGVGNV